MSEMTVGCIRTTVTPPLAGGIYEALLEKAERERNEANEELHKQLIRYDALFDEAEKIRIERDHYKQALEGLFSSTEKWANSHVPANQSLDFIKKISSHIKKQLNKI